MHRVEAWFCGYLCIKLGGCSLTPHPRCTTTSAGSSDAMLEGVNKRPARWVSRLEIDKLVMAGQVE